METQRGLELLSKDTKEMLLVFFLKKLIPCGDHLKPFMQYHFCQELSEFGAKFHSPLMFIEIYYVAGKTYIKIQVGFTLKPSKNLLDQL